MALYYWIAVLQSYCCTQIDKASGVDHSSKGGGRRG